ncbi:hypothetical protein HanRHA438_Chr15g0697621 [Helianthus annuus]|nr:hypothetical protein HanRHA438_Chr15g0697621 [Helianthus annuus]
MSYLKYDSERTLANDTLSHIAYCLKYQLQKIKLRYMYLYEKLHVLIISHVGLKIYTKTLG